MDNLPNATPLHTVLETLIGDNPYNDDYPRDLLITFEKSPNGAVHRIFFALYGRGKNFRAEARHLPSRWPDHDPRDANSCSLLVERYFTEDRRAIKSNQICRAFLKVALERFRQDMGGNQP